MNKCPYCDSELLMITPVGTPWFMCGTVLYEEGHDFCRQRKALNQPSKQMSTIDKLVELIRQRHEAGLAHYKVTVDRTDFTADQWAKHAIEELLDGAAYLMRLREEIAKKDERIAALEAAGDSMLKATRYTDESVAYCERRALTAEAELNWLKAKKVIL